MEVIVVVVVAVVVVVVVVMVVVVVVQVVVVQVVLVVEMVDVVARVACFFRFYFDALPQNLFTLAVRTCIIHSITRRHRNMRSTAHIALSSGTVLFSFRNPPSFHQRFESSVRDAEHETEALITYLFNHQSTPPFVASLLIQV